MTLPPQITIRNIEPVPDVEPFIIKEIAVLERFFKRIMSCRVMIERTGSRRFGAPYHVRIDLGVPGGELVVDYQPTLHTSLKETEALKETKRSEIKRASREMHRAIHEAFGEMRRRVQDYVRRMQRQTKQHHFETPARIVRLFEDYGFLETSDGREIYFHRNSVLDNRFDLLRLGSKVHFTEEAGEKGPQASTVSLLHATRQSRETRKAAVVQKRGAM